MCVDRRTLKKGEQFVVLKQVQLKLEIFTHRPLMSHPGPVPNDPWYAALAYDLSAALRDARALLHALRLVVPGQRTRCPRCREVGALFERAKRSCQVVDK